MVRTTLPMIMPDSHHVPVRTCWSSLTSSRNSNFDPSAANLDEHTGDWPGIFQDKKIMSDAKYWWTRSSKAEAKENQEYIRVCDDDGEEMFPSFMDFFAEFPTSALANITCTLKLKTTR